MSTSYFKNTLINLTGQILPLFVAFFTVPKIISLLGQERFSLLTLTWIIVGYFSIFDFGIGRSLTNFVAEKFPHKTEGAQKLVSQSLAFLFLLSLVMALICYFGGEYLIQNQFQFTDMNLKQEALKALFWISLTVPVITLFSGVKGILEGVYAFTLANQLNVLIGISTYLIPLGVGHFNLDLESIIIGLFIWRILCLLIATAILHKKYFTLKLQTINLSELKPLLTKGGWISVTNIISPLMAYMDRFILTSIMPIASIAFYTTPFEIISRLWVIPTAVTRTSFSRFSTDKDQPENIASVFDKSLRTIHLLLYPLVFILFAYSSEILRLWINADFSASSSIVLQIFVLGIYFNSLNWVPFSLLQSSQHVKWTAIIPIFELIIYLPLYYWATKKWGLSGAAIMWSLRLIEDGTVFFLLTRRYYPFLASTIMKNFILTLTLYLLIFPTLYFNLEFKLIYSFIILVSFAFYFYKKLLLPEEKKVIFTNLRKLQR